MDSLCNPDFPLNSCMFFKIILHNDIAQGKLEIPSKFVAKYGNRLRSPIILKIPNGKEWQIELSNAGEEVWFEKGWKEFAEHYSLKHGHLLVFNYEGNYHFNVNIFDMGAVGIQYPCEGSKTQPIMNTNKETPPPIKDEPKPQSTDEENSLLPDALLWPGNMASSNEVASAINFTPNNPWFKVVIKSNHIKQNYLTIPFGFFKKHMEGKAKTIMLKVEEKSWPVKLHVYPHSRTANFYHGFRSFLTENSLRKGNACVLEMINNYFNVSIFRT